MAKLILFISFLACGLAGGTEPGLKSQNSGKSANSQIAQGSQRKIANEPSLKIEFLKAIEISSKEEFKKTRIGGISGLAYDPESSLIWGVSDDRGKFGAPRIYKWLLKKDLTLELQDLVFVKDKDKRRPVFDLESIALLPWGNFLLNSEGDDRTRPAREPRLFEVKPSGEYVRDYKLPDHFLPGKSGAEPRGLRTNFGFEAMGTSLDGKSWVLGSEAWLAQDTENISHLIKYDMKEAWVLEPGQEWIYNLNYEQFLANGLTELQNYKEDRWFFLERTVQLEGQKILAQSQLLEGRIDGKGPLTAKPLLDFWNAKFKGVNTKQNYEAMTFGPAHENGRLLIIANDNNFETSDPTQFLFFKVTEEPVP